MVESGELSKVGTSDVRRRVGKVQDANAGDCGRKRFSRAIHAVAGIFQRVATPGSAVEVGGVS